MFRVFLVLCYISVLKVRSENQEIEQCRQQNKVCEVPQNSNLSGYVVNKGQFDKEGCTTSKYQ